MLPHRYGRKMGIKELIKNKTDKKNVSDSQHCLVLENNLPPLPPSHHHCANIASQGRC